MWARPSTAVHRGIAMAVLFARRTLVVPALVIVVHTAALAQTAAAPARPPAGPTGTTAAWTLKLTGDVRWQQVTPAGALRSEERRVGKECRYRQAPHEYEKSFEESREAVQTTGEATV